MMVKRKLDGAVDESSADPEIRKSDTTVHNLWKVKCLPGKSVRNASKLLKQCSTLAKQSRKLNISIYSKLLKFQASPKFRQPACGKTWFR